MEGVLPGGWSGDGGFGHGAPGSRMTSSQREQTSPLIPGDCRDASGYRDVSRGKPAMSWDILRMSAGSLTASAHLLRMRAGIAADPERGCRCLGTFSGCLRTLAQIPRHGADVSRVSQRSADSLAMRAHIVRLRADIGADPWTCRR